MLIYKDEVVADYRSIFPNTSFSPGGPSDEFLVEQNAYKVNLFIPHDTRTEKLVACLPYIQGGWAYTVEVEPKTEEELAADTENQATVIRTERNRKLAACDWTQLGDIPVETSSAWIAYRQELRDISNQIGFPWEVIWPEEPTI